MLNFKFRSLLLFYFLLLVNPLQAQSTFSNLEPFYINYTTDDGLPSSECHQTIQDQKGYIWIATDNGVSRFDGYGFRNFSADDGLKNNVVFYLQEDRQGRIWMLTMSGNLYYYDYETDKIYSFQYNTEIQKYQGKYTWVSPFYIDSTSTIYLGLDNLGVLEIKSNGESFLYQSDELSALVIVEVEDFLIYSYKSCLISQLEECRTRFTLKKRLPPWKFYQNRVLVKKLHFELKDELNDAERMAFKLKAATRMVKKMSNGQIIGQSTNFNYLINEDYSFQHVKRLFKATNEKTIAELDNGKILIGEIFPGGVYEIENNRQFIDKEKSINFLKNKQVSSIRQGDEGGLWLTSTKNGLYYIPNYDDKIINKRIGIQSDNISSFSIENGQKILLGQGKNDIYEVDLEKKHLLKLPPYIGGGLIRKIYKDHRTNKIWIASGNLSWLENDKWNYWVSTKNGKQFGAIGIAKSFNLSKDKNYLWSWRGLSFLKINLLTNKVEFDAIDFNIREPFKCVYEDFSGRIWLGNLRGFFEFKDSIMIPQMAHPAFQVRVEDIQQLQDSTLIIGTKGGGIVFWKGAEIIQVTRKEGLTSNMIENIYVDSLQRTWVGTSEGLNMIKFDKNKRPFVKQYTQKHGLPSNEINQVEVYGENVWVATTKGLARLPEWEVDTVANAPIIEKILVNGSPVNNFEHQSIRLKAEQNSLQIAFLTIDYKQHGNVQYRYKLRPSQKEWNYSKNRKLDFSALSNNDYRLEIQSQNRDGYWSKSTVFEFTILPPFWKTWWFVLGVILLGGTILFFWIKRIRREANLVRKMAEAEQFALRSQMNPHFIFNCLASIQGFVSTGEKDKAIRYLSRFSKLIRTSLQFMNKEKITLEEEITMITNYLELEKMRHGEKFSYQLEISDELDIEETEIPPLMVQPFVENSILHAFVDKKSGGLLTIKYQVENSRFQVIIKDNGIGLTESHKRKNKIANSHKSVGTKIIARRLELKKKDTENGLLMTEIKGQNGQVEGTKVVINFGKVDFL